MISKVAEKKEISQPEKKNDRYTKIVEKCRQAKEQLLEWVKSDDGWKPIGKITTSKHNHTDKKKSHNIYSQNYTTEVKEYDSKHSKGYKKSIKTYKIWKSTYEIDSPLEKMIEILSNIENASKWNEIVAHAKIIETINSSIDITVCASNPAILKIVDSRDFVTLRQCEKGPDPDSFLIVTTGTHKRDYKVPPKTTRGWNGPGGFYLQSNQKGGCHITWILNAYISMPTLIPDILYENTIIDLTKNLIKSLHHLIEKEKKVNK